MNRVMAFFYYYGMIALFGMISIDMLTTMENWGALVLLLSVAVLISIHKRIGAIRTENPRKAYLIGNALMWGGTLLFMLHFMIGYTAILAQH